VEEHLKEAVKASPVEFTDEFIAKTTDWPKAAKCYKIKTGGQNVVTEDLELEVLGKMVMRAVG
jgi:hypothetical protein